MLRSLPDKLISTAHFQTIPVPTCIYAHKSMNMLISVSMQGHRQVQEQRLIWATQNSRPILYIAVLEFHPSFLHVAFILLRNLMLSPF